MNYNKGVSTSGDAKVDAATRAMADIVELLCDDGSLLTQ